MPNIRFRDLKFELMGGTRREEWDLLQTCEVVLEPEIADRARAFTPVGRVGEFGKVAGGTEWVGAADVVWILGGG